MKPRATVSISRAKNLTKRDAARLASWLRGVAKLLTGRHRTNLHHKFTAKLYGDQS